MFSFLDPGFLGAIAGADSTYRIIRTDSSYNSYYSDDGGLTWVFIDTLYQYNRIGSLVFRGLRASPNTVTVSLDNGNTWKATQAGWWAVNTQLSYANGYYIYNFGSTLKYSTDGITWLDGVGTGDSSSHNIVYLYGYYTQALCNGTGCSYYSTSLSGPWTLGGVFSTSYSQVLVGYGACPQCIGGVILAPALSPDDYSPINGFHTSSYPWSASGATVGTDLCVYQDYIWINGAPYWLKTSNDGYVTTTNGTTFTSVTTGINYQRNGSPWRYNGKYTYTQVSGGALLVTLGLNSVVSLSAASGAAVSYA